MADETARLRATLLQRDEALATLNKERAAMQKDIDRYKENMKRGDMELRKAVGALRLPRPRGGPSLASAPRAAAASPRARAPSPSLPSPSLSPLRQA
jgi:hypothetical protein